MPSACSMQVARLSTRHSPSCGRISTSLGVSAPGLPGNRWGSTSEALCHMVTVNGGARVKWSGDSYVSKQNEKKRLNWSPRSSRMASFDPKRRTERRARTVRPSAKPLAPCRRVWKKMRRAVLRCNMSSSRVATFSSSTIVFPLRTKSCNRSPGFKSGSSRMQATTGVKKVKPIAWLWIWMQE